MVSVDRNTLISQIVSLNPQLKPDELRKLSDAQLHAKLSQCIAGNKQDKNVDSIKINNTNTSETPKMTTEEAQDNAIENIESNAEQAQKLLEAQDNGDISKAYNFVKEKLNSELAKSNVAKVVHKQFETAEFLREAKQGTLTYKEYLRRKRGFLFNSIPNINNYNDKQRALIKNMIEALSPDKLDTMQTKVLNLPDSSSKEYTQASRKILYDLQDLTTKHVVNNNTLNLVSNKIKGTETKDHTKSSINNIKVTIAPPFIMEEAEAERLMTFEETYLLEQGVEFNKENIQKFNDSVAQYTFANNLHNRLQDIHNMLDNDITLVKGNNANGVDLKTLENGNKRLKTSIYQALSKLYGNDINKINKGLQDLTGETYEFKQKNNDTKQGLTLDNLELVDSSIPEDSKFKPNTDMVLPSLAEKVLKGLDTNYSKALNGKKLEDYAIAMAEDYKKAFGTKDATALASSFAQDQEDIVQTARNTVQIAGMGVMVGGMAFYLPAAFIGGLISSFGGIAVEAYNENTKENPNEEKNKELRQEVLVNAALFAIGAGSGKVGSMAKTALTAKNAPKLVAAMADIGVDSSLSLLGDLTLTGQIDLSGEGFSQLMALVAGHKGKIVKGVQKGKQFLKEKFNAQANSNNKILQMPDGTVVEVKPDGSTVEVKADGEGTKAVKPEAKTENVKTETTLKTKKELESALDKATTREDFLAIRNEILKMPNSPERVKLFELYLKTYQDWSTKRVNGNDPNQYTDKPNMAVKNMAEADVKSETFKSEDEFKEYLKKQTSKARGQVTQKFTDAEINELIKLQQKQPNFNIKNIIDLYPYSKGNESLELISSRKFNPEIFDLLISETKKSRFGDTFQRFSSKEINDIMSNLNEDNTSFAKKLIQETKSHMGIEVKAYDGTYISAFLQLQNKFGNINSLKDYMNIVKERNISAASVGDNQILNLVLNEDKTTFDQVVKMYKYKSLQNGKSIYTNSSTEIKKTINFLKQNNKFKENLSNIYDKRITDEVDNLLAIGKIKDAEDLVDVINNFNQKYHTIYDSNNPYFKEKFSSASETLKFSKYFKSQGMSLEDLVNGNITEQLRKQLIKNGLSVETLINDFRNDIKYRMMENFINKNPDSDISNYLYENYYLKDIATQKIDSSLLEKRNNLINACKKINQRFNVKIIMSSDISNAYKTISYVYKELTNWIKVSEGKAKFPPIIDFSTAKSNWYDTTSAYGKSASAGYSHPAYNGAIAFKDFKLKTVSNAMRHELTHTNDLKRGTKIPKDYNLNEIMPKFDETLPNGNIIKSGDAKKGKYYQEFVNGGISDYKISYAYNNTKEFIAVASEGDMSKYSSEFKQVLIDFGMPEWIFNLEK